MRHSWRTIATAKPSLADNSKMRGGKNRGKLRLTLAPSRGISETANLMDCVAPPTGLEPVTPALRILTI
jgi:hypothetical protein